MAPEAKQAACLWDADTHRQCLNEQMFEIHLRYLMRMHCQTARLEKFKWSYKMKSGLIDTAARQTHMERKNKKETSCFLVPTCGNLNIESSDKPAATPHSISCTAQSPLHLPSTEGGQPSGQVLGIAHLHFIAFGENPGPALSSQCDFSSSGVNVMVQWETRILLQQVQELFEDSGAVLPHLGNRFSRCNARNKKICSKGPRNNHFLPSLLLQMNLVLLCGQISKAIGYMDNWMTCYSQGGRNSA